MHCADRRRCARSASARHMATSPRRRQGIRQQVVALEVQLDVLDAHELDLVERDDVATEFAVEHHHDRTPGPSRLPSKPYRTIGGRRHPSTRMRMRSRRTHRRHDPSPVCSTITASERAGHRRSASPAHSSKGRSVSARSARSRRSSTHRKVPAPPK